jgi:hypothetical protein
MPQSFVQVLPFSRQFGENQKLFTGGNCASLPTREPEGELLRGNLAPDQAEDSRVRMWSMRMLTRSGYFAVETTPGGIASKS